MSRNLTLDYEPEAAGLYCQSAPVGTTYDIVIAMQVVIGNFVGMCHWSATVVIAVLRLWPVACRKMLRWCASKKGPATQPSKDWVERAECIVFPL